MEAVRPLVGATARVVWNRMPFKSVALSVWSVWSVWSVCSVVAVVVPAELRAQAPAHAVVLIAIDGLRWQEFFTGADTTLISRTMGGVGDTAGLRKEFWRADPRARRRMVFPFLWDSIAVRGSIWGSPDAGSDARVTNGKKFSYPGYNEMLTGRADSRIDKNDYGPNPNVTIHKYPGADHAFARHGGKTYSKPEADRALALTVDFFKKHLGSS